MEVVAESSVRDVHDSGVLNGEMERMKQNVQRVLDGGSGSRPPIARVPSMGVQRTSSMRGAPNGMRGPPPSGSRAVQRTSSMRGVPTKGVQRTNSLRGGSPLQRTSSLRVEEPVNGSGSSRAVIRGSSARLLPRRAPPSRTNSLESTHSLQSFRKDQMNTAIEPKEPGRTPGPGGTLQRHESEMTSGEFSCYTLDSVNLRKSQLVADPLEEGTYLETDSYADHESVSRCSVFTEYVPERVLAVDKLNLGSSQHYEEITDNQSVASCLTNDFSEYGYDFSEVEVEEDPAEWGDLKIPEGVDDLNEVEEDNESSKA